MKPYNTHILIAEVTHPSGVTLVFPQLLPDIVQLNLPPWKLAERLASEIQSTWLESGEYRELMTLTLDRPMLQQQIEVPVQASSEKLYPALTLKFDLFSFQLSESQHIGFVPVLRLETTGESPEKLIENVVSNVQLEFVRKRRLNSVRTLLATQWQEKVSLHKQPVTHYTYSLLELEQRQQQEDQKLLEKVAAAFPLLPGELYGLEEELDQLLTAMKGKGRNSALIIGGSGQGKTELLREFRRVKKHHGLDPIELYEVTAGQLLHRLSGMGRWEEYLADLCRELRQSGHILYLPNFSELFEVGQYAGNDLSFADYLRPYIARGEISLLSECTPEEASRIELRSPGYLALMQVVKIKEMETPQLQEVLWKKAQWIGKRYETEMEEAAVREILRLQQWYTPYSGLPGKTLAFLEALASEEKQVDKPAVYRAFSQETGMPEFMINPEKPLTFEEMDRFFHKNIYGQEEAIGTLSELFFAIKAAVIKRGKPLASLLFVGPTGVGKTELAKVLASYLFGNRDRMLRFDMSEYSDLGSVMRLTGDSRGGEGLLTATVRQNPFSVILFDELEKVHPAFYDLLLQILGEGRLTDARGRVADFCSTIIIMTSNIGARAFQMGSVGFGESLEQRGDAGQHFRKAVQDHFRPELFNRIDRIVTFEPLDRKVIRQIVDREAGLILQREGLRGRKVALDITPEALDYLGEVGYNALYGARYLQRTLRKQLLIPLAQKLNSFPYSLALEGQVTQGEKGLQIELRQKGAVSLFDKQLEGKPGLKLGDFLEQVTQSRRMAGRIVNAQVFNRLLSQLYTHERKLAKLKKRGQEALFWQNPQQSKELHQLGKLKKAFFQKQEEIESLEEENLMLLAGGNVKVDTQLQRFLQWEQGFLEQKVEVVAWNSPAFESCTLGLYGNRYFAFPIARIYLELAKEWDCAAEAFTVWYEKKGEESLEHESEGEPEEERGEDKPYYVRMDFKQHNPGRQYSFVGIQIHFKGKLPYLFFKGEEGNHYWIEKNNERHPFVVTLSEGKPDSHQAPEGVHRKAFFSKNNFRHPRREYHAIEGIKDELYKIHRPGKDFIGILFPVLQERFYKELDQYLLS